MLETQDDVQMSLVFVIDTDAADVANSYSVDMSLMSDGNEFMKMQVSQDSSNRSMVDMSFNIPELLKIAMKMEMLFTKSDVQPLGKPTEESIIIPFDLGGAW